jgi:hypothetical protein
MNYLWRTERSSLTTWYAPWYEIFRCGIFIESAPDGLNQRLTLGARVPNGTIHGMKPHIEMHP